MAADSGAGSGADTLAVAERAGELVSEIEHHGLTSIPDPGVASLAEVPVETYSNNIGFYNQVFTLEITHEQRGRGSRPEHGPGESRTRGVRGA